MNSSSVSRRRILRGTIAFTVFCCLLAAALGALTASPAMAAPARAPAEQGCSATVTVANNADSGAGSLRQALVDVCAGGTIDFGAGLDGQTITLTSAQITIDKNVTITGTVPVTISGNNAFRVLQVNLGVNAALYGLTLTEGNPGTGESGGAVNNYGTLVIANSSLTGSTAEGGGGVYNDSAAILTVMGSRISGNSSTTSGGGIANFGALTVTRSTIDTNQAATTGGGVINAKEMTLTASTIADNQAPSGAGIYNNTGMTLNATQITVSGNKATGLGGGLYTHLGVTLSGSVLSGNTGGDCLAGDPISSGGYNVVSDTSCSLAGTGDQNDKGPQTLALQPDGTAPLDPTATASHGSVNDAVLCANLDQLGYPRHSPSCDAGALEANELHTLTVAKTGAGSGVLTPTVGAHIYVSNTLVSVEAAPAISSTLTGWSGDCTGTGACSVTMLADKVVTANFAVKQFTVTVSADPAAGGTVQGGGTYAYGSTVVVTAATNAGYTFGGWKENTSVVDTGAVYTFTATADRTLVAAYTPICPVTTNADSGPGSLRQAVADAAPGAILCFNPLLSGQTILFGSPIVIDKSLTINGNLPVILDGQGSYRIFEVSAGGSLSLNALTLRNGKGAAPGGGAILVAAGGTLATTGVTFGSSQTAGKGGAILNGGTTTVSHSTFSANSAGQGGGIANDGGTATVSTSVFGVNTGGNCWGTMTSSGYNVVGDGSCNFTGRGDINDAPLPVAGAGTYGRMPLTADSLAVNNVTDPAFCAGTDQAGNTRSTPCAAGALEFVTPGTTLHVASGGSDTGNNCASAGSPCATLTHALVVAVDGSTIRMAGGAPYIVANEPISKSVLILGDGPGQTILQAGAVPSAANGRVLGVVPGQKVTLYGVTVRYGWTSGQAAGGGGIVNGGTLTLRNSAVLSNTIMAGNGAGIYNGGGGLLVVYNSTLAGNRVIRQAAAAMAPGAVAGAIPGLPVSALPGLVGLLSGGGMIGLAWTVTGGRPKRPWQRRTLLLFLAMLVLSGCTDSCGSPTDGAGGALFNDHGSTAVIRFTTLAGNSAYLKGGGFYNAATTYDANGALTQPAGVLKLAGSVLSQNDGGNCSGGALVSGGANVSSDPSCGLDKATDANWAGDQVGTLGSNGTMPLQTGSGAVDLVPAACPGIDQVSVARPAPCDGGAAESGSTGAAHLLVDVSADPGRPYQGQTVVFTATVRNTGAGTAVDPRVTLTWPAGIQMAPFSVTGGTGCSWQSGTLTCASLGPRSQLVLVMPGKLTTAARYVPLNLIVSATANAPAVGGTGMGTIITDAVPPPPPFAVGPTRYYKTIQSAVDAAPAGETISVDDGTYVENVVINKNLTIRPAMPADHPIVDGNGTGSVFTIGAGVDVNLDGLTIRHGMGTHRAPVPQGGGIYSSGTLVVSNCTISDNQAASNWGGEGGGIYNNKGVLTVDTCTFTHNQVQGLFSSGGGIYSHGLLTVSNSSFNGNSSSGSGPGNGGGAGSGGGISSFRSVLAVSNSTFSGNMASDGAGGIFLAYGTGSVRHSTFSGNKAKEGASMAVSADPKYPTALTVQDSIMRGNDSPAVTPKFGGTIVVENSIVQAAIGGINNRIAEPTDPLFVRPPSAGDYGDLRLVASAPARNLGHYCNGSDAQDMVGTTRNTPTCDAGAYEFLSTDAGSGQVAAASAGTTVFSNAGGAVTLTVPTDAAAQPVELAFSIGQPTGGDGRARGVVFTSYDAGGQPLGENFTFLKPLQVTLEYNPALVTHGPETALLPMRFQPSTGTWLPFTQDVVIDRFSRKVSFPIIQAGEYGLFSFTPGAHVTITPFKAGGTTNLDGGSTVLYTLAVINANYAPATNLAISHALPPGLSFGGWVNEGTATESGGVITWNLPALAGGGAAWVSFNALVSTDAAYRGQAITSSVTLGGSAGSSQATISVNGPTTPVDDAATTRPDTPVSVQPLLNDINPDGSPVLLTELVAPAHGTATILGATVLYTPTAGFEGSDSFMYRLQDGLFTAQGTITVRTARLAFLNVAKLAASSSASGFFLPAVAQGSTVTYTILLENMNGGEIAQNAVLTDVLPAGVQFTRWITQSGAALNGSTITWSTASVPLGGGTTISYLANVSGSPGARIANSVQASATNADVVSGEADIILGNWTSIYLPQVRR